MVLDLGDRPSSCPQNFIRRNIQNCGNPSRLSSAPLDGLGIRGIPLYIRAREKLKSKDSLRKQELRPKVSHVSIEKHKPTVVKPKVDDHPEAHCLIRFNSGVRRTSIKSKDHFLEDNTKNKEQESALPFPKKSSRLRGPWYLNRQVLRLPVTLIPQPENPRLPPEAFLQVTGQSFQKSGKEAWEAVDNRLESCSEKTFEGLLAAMEGQTKSNVNASAILSGQTRCTNGNTRPLSDLEQQKTDLDNSYHIYQRHLETLSNVITQDSSQIKEEPSKGTQKRKLLPKLEINIAGDVQRQNQDMKVITQGLEEVSVLEELDNCGNLTPVITYNHVSTFNCLEEFISAVSPGGSSKSSRSPSPLLEIPNTGEGKNTKRPPL